MNNIIDVTASISTAEKEPLFKAEETKESCRCEEGALPDEAISSQRETASPKNGSQRHQFFSSLFLAKQSPRSEISSFSFLVSRFSFLISFFFLSSFFLSSCASVTQTPQMEIVSVYSTSAAQPWLTELYDCAANQPVTLRLTDSSSDAAIYIRIGEPDVLMTPAYQIGTEEILIITHRESPVQNLTIEEARTLFAGQGDPSVRIWIYSSDEDIQRVFDQLVMTGRSVTSSASLAVSPGQMSDVLNAESSAVGILPRHWMTGNVREVYSLGNVPVLAIVREEPQGSIKELVGCLQK